MFIPGVESVLDLGIGAAAGYVAGAFTPAIGRKIKALFVKDTGALKVDAAKAQAALEVANAKVAASVAADAAKVAAKA